MKENSYGEISAKLTKCKSSANDIVNRFKLEDRIESILQKSRNLITRNVRKIIRKIKKDPMFSAPRFTSGR